MSKKIPIICEVCDAQFRVPSWVEEAACPVCGFPNAVELGGYEDRRDEDAQ